MRNTMAVLLCAIIGLVWTSCSPEKDPMVAKVAGRRITLSEYEQMAAGLLAKHYKDAEVSPETRRAVALIPSTSKSP